MRALPIAAFLLLTACEDSPPPNTPATNGASGTAAATGSANVGSTVTPATPATPAGKSYSIVASFSGTDQKARDSVNEVVNQWRIAKGAKLETKRPKWGANGESDICVDLSELSEADRTKAIGEMKSAVGSDDKVKLSENASCHEDKK